jgi:hypothetical protein
MSKARRRYRSLVAVTPIAPRPQAPSQSGHWIPDWLLAALVVLAILGAVELVRWIFPSVRPPASASHDGDVRVRPGDLVVETRLVPIPDEILPHWEWGGSRRWRLPGYSRTQATALLADLRGAEETLDCGAEGCTLRPELDAVADLSASSRARIYSVLVRISGNSQAENTFYRVAERGPFSATPGIPDAARPLVDALTWTRSGVPAFSDVTVVCARLGSAAECRRFMQAMLSRPTASVSLQLTPPGAIDRIVAAFDSRERAVVRERLETLRTAGRQSVVLESLLPLWARTRLGTFPPIGEEWTNCFWTSLRFLEIQSEPIESGAQMDALLRRDFSPVTSAAQFGDVLVLRDHERGAVHAATWLLGGYLFEKNGTGRLQAWRIVPLAEVTAEFPEADAMELWRLRARP